VPRVPARVPRKTWKDRLPHAEMALLGHVEYSHFRFYHR
jgi:hypothetical protein